MEVIAVLEDLALLLDGLDGGTLTDDEREAIKVARAILEMADMLSDHSAIFQVAALIPWERLAKLLVTWRRIVINAQSLMITIPELGPDVEIVESK